MQAPYLKPRGATAHYTFGKAAQGISRRMQTPLWSRISADRQLNWDSETFAPVCLNSIYISDEHVSGQREKKTWKHVCVCATAHLQDTFNFKSPCLIIYFLSFYG